MERCPITTREAGAELIPIQPFPRKTKVAHTHNPSGWTTSICRTFDPTEVPRCKLCPRQLCGADEDGECLVATPQFVPEESCALYVLRAGRVMVPGPGLDRAAH